MAAGLRKALLPVQYTGSTTVRTSSLVEVEEVEEEQPRTGLVTHPPSPW